MSSPRFRVWVRDESYAWEMVRALAPSRERMARAAARVYEAQGVESIALPDGCVPVDFRPGGA